MKLKILLIFLVLIICFFTNRLLSPKNIHEKPISEKMLIKKELRLTKLKQNKNFDPGSLGELLANSQNIEDRSRTIEGASIMWSKNDPESCFAWAKSLANPSEISNAVVSTISTILNGGAGDFDLALKLIDQLAKGEIRDDVIIYNFSNLVDMNQDQTIKLIATLSGSGAISAAARELANALVEKGNDIIISDLWNQMDYGTFKNEFAINLAKSLSKKNPILALNWLENHTDFDAHLDAYQAIGSAFGDSNPIKGLELSKSISDKKMRDAYLHRLGLEWSRQDPANAGQTVIDQINTNGYLENSEISKTIMSGWIRWSHEEPFKKISEIQNEIDRKNLLTEAIQALAHYDAKAAFSKIPEVANLSSTDSVEITKKIVSGWLDKDSIQASESIGKMQPGPAKDASISLIVSVLLNLEKNTQMSTSWALQISNLGERQKALDQINKVKK